MEQQLWLQDVGLVCLDERQMAVARFSANAWATSKVGNIKFMGPRATEQGVRDENVVTGLTLFYCMVLRPNSLLSLIGAMVAQPGPLDKESANEPNKNKPQRRVTMARHRV